jgi:hypothetical protein
MLPAACQRCFGSRRENDVDLEPDELGRELGDPLGASFAPAVLYLNGATLDPAEFAQSVHKGTDPLGLTGTRARAKETDGRHLERLLRPHRERRKHRRGRRAAEQRDEVAPCAHSITSSARVSTVAGTSRPSALAVLRLITSSYLVGACTGRSAGFSPLRMRST